MLQSFNILRHCQDRVSHLSLLCRAFLIGDRGVLEPAAGSCGTQGAVGGSGICSPFPGCLSVRSLGIDLEVEEPKGGYEVANMGSPVPPGLCWTRFPPWVPVCSLWKWTVGQLELMEVANWEEHSFSLCSS